MIRVLVFSAVAVLLFVSPALADINGPARVIDGDTIDIAGESIRLHGIDAPENAQTCIADGVTWPCGKRATAALVEFIDGAPVSCREQEVLHIEVPMTSGCFMQCRVLDDSSLLSVIASRLPIREILP